MDMELIERVKKYALGAESQTRFEHSVRTAQTAEKLCRRYGVDPEKGYFAGIAHDMCKEMNPRLLLSLAARDGAPVTELEQEKPSLLHGRAAAAMLKSDFAVDDADILEAVRNHTFGAPGMSALAKIIYAADKIEPGREHVTPAYLDRLFSLSLNGLVRTVVQENIGWLENRNKSVAPVSRRFLESLED